MPRPTLKKDLRVNIKVQNAGLAHGILNLATDYFKDPENMKAFQEWKAAKKRKNALQEAL